MKYGLILVLFLWFNHPFIRGQNVTLESLTIENGLSQGMIYDILQSRDGFLWIGTKDGLNRYDGYNFKVWNNDPNNPWSLAENTVTALFEDSRGWLWVGYENNGIGLFDRQTERFYHFSLPFADSRGKQELYDIRQITEDTGGNIWIASRSGGVFRLQIPAAWKNTLPGTPEPAPGAISSVSFPKNNVPGAPLFETFRALLPRPDGSIWVGSSNALYAVDTRTLAARHIQTRPGIPAEVWHLIQSKPGDVWGVSETGLFRIRDGVFKYFSLLAGDAKRIETNPALTEDKDGRIWVLLENKIWRLSPQGTIDLQKPDYTTDQKGNVVFPDRQGNIWLGTLGYGIRKITPRKAMFNPMLEGVSIWGIWQDNAGNLLCKLFNKIVRLDAATGKLSGQSAFPDALPLQNDLLREPSGNFWLLCGLHEKGISKSELRYYNAGGTLISVREIPLNRYPYTRLLRTRDGAVWVSGTSGQLLRFEPHSGDLLTFNFGFLFEKNAPTLFTYALVEDGNGHIWAGTQLGLVKGVFKAGKMDFQVFKSNAQDPESLNNNSIACLLPDPRQPESRLWIGTKGGGINCLDLQTGSFSQITTEQGLPNNVVYGILPDDTGCFWCSTNRGLARLTFNGSTLLQIAPFTAADGLQSNEFNTQAFFKSPNGELFFGGVNGLNRFLPAALQFNSTPPPVYVTGLEINYHPQRFSAAGSMLKMPVEYLRRLELNHDQNNLSVEFAAMDLTDPAKNRYRYQLLPIEKAWISARKGHFAYYTHLAPGHYVFRVTGSNSDGAWNETPVEMHIVIHPPWWNSWPARLAYLLALIWIAWQVWRFQVRRVQLREQLAFEQRETERIKALEQLKTNFFNNITHEFRTPLSLILEPARQINAQSKDPAILENAGRIESNGRRLLGLVNQLLDLAKLESGSMSLDLRYGDIGQTVRAVFESFLPLATQRNIKLELTLPAATPSVEFDGKKVELVLNNLISNALKFTPEGGKIDVLLRIGNVQWGEHKRETANPESSILIEVIDTGIGIPTEALDKIFDRFYQADFGTPGLAHTGTGIGLALSKELATLMGGGITVQSKVGTGSAFTFYLPFKVLSVSVPKAAASSEPGMAEQPDWAPPHAVDQERPVALVIEDNPDLRAFISQSIGNQWQVAEAPDGAAGIRMAKELIPDLVISDLMMPGKDGYAVCDALKNDELTAHIPVILLTAKTGTEARIKGLRTGADDYLTKPFHTEELLARMENLVSMRRKLRQRYSRQPAENAGSKAPSEREFLSPPDVAFLERFTLTLEQNLSNETLGVEEFAQKMFISRVQLHRKLKALTDQSATDFIRDYRLNKAMTMLKNREGLVSEVASNVGFGNEKYFSTVFKEKFGIPPSQVK